MAGATTRSNDFDDIAVVWITRRVDRSRLGYRIETSVASKYG
jgi:hypothetical protein